MRRSIIRGSVRDQKKAFSQCRVFLDGEDVTNDCREADDRIGRVRLIYRDADGRAWLNRTGTGPREVWRHGKVKIVAVRTPSLKPSIRFSKRRAFVNYINPTWS